MRYDYRCDECGQVQEVIHGMEEDPVVRCLHCNGPSRRIIQAPQIRMTRWGNRDTRHPERPSNAEYQAYCAWEAAGGEPGTFEHKQFLHSRGDL